MFEAVCRDNMRSSVAAIARDIDMPVATAHRQVATLVDIGVLLPLPKGRFAPSWKVSRLIEAVDRNKLRVLVSETVLEQIARESGAVVQLGTLENYMVTYLVKKGRDADDIFTKVGMQLEAYCSGLGKILLAQLSQNDLENYLTNGPFVALTRRTKTDPGELAAEIERVKAQGFAQDIEEVFEGLRCVAVPLSDPDGKVRTAISLSRLSRKTAPEAQHDLEADIEKLRKASETITKRLGGNLCPSSGHSA